MHFSLFHTRWGYIGLGRDGLSDDCLCWLRWRGLRANNAEDFIDDSRYTLIGRDRDLICKRWRKSDNVFMCHVMPHGKNNFVAMLFPGHKPVQFALRPLLGKEMRTEDDNTELRCTEALLNSTTETVPLWGKALDVFVSLYP